MTALLPPEVMNYLTVSEVGLIRKLSPTAARDWITTYRKQMPAELVDAVISHVEQIYKPTTMQTAGTPTPRSYFVAAAWLAGASWGQLGKMFNIDRSSAIRQAERRIGFGVDRQALRLIESVSYETLSSMYEVFRTLDDITIRRTRPVDLARMLLDKARAEASDDGFEPLAGDSREI